MKCIRCKDGNIIAGFTTVTLERGGVTLVMKNVPADICDICGEKYFTEKTVAALRQTLESAESMGEEVQVRLFAA